MVDKLTGAKRDEALTDLRSAGWIEVDGRDAIRRQFKFKTFVDAFGWMTKVSFWAEKLNHHPEWSNVYNRVDVTLITHSCDGLSDLDIKLAKKMDNFEGS